MRIFNELRYPSSNLSEIFTQRMFQASFEKIWKIFFELSRGQAWSYGRTDRQTDRQTDGQTDRQTDRRTDAGNDNTPPALGPRGKNQFMSSYYQSYEHVFCISFNPNHSSYPIGPQFCICLAGTHKHTMMLLIFSIAFCWRKNFIISI